MMPFTILWDLYLNHKTCRSRKSSPYVRVLAQKPVFAKYERGTLLKPSDEICVLSFNLLLIYYISNVNLHEFLKFEYLHVTYNLAVEYMNSKKVSRLIMKYVYTF
jgi:hypothetical protein